MTDATSTRVSIIREITPGVLPANPQMQQLRFNSSNLSTSTTSVTSDEIDDTRNISDSSLVGIENGGDIGVELSYLSHDELVAGALFGNWVSHPEAVNKTTDDEITELTTSVITVDSPIGSSFSVDDVVRLFGFDNSANNVVTTVTASTATSITVDATLVATASVNAGARVKKVGVQSASGDLSTSVSPNSLTSSITLDFTTLGIVPGSWVKIGGADTANSFATEEVNGFCRVLSVSADVLVFDIVPAGFVADAGTGKTIRLFLGDYIRNGTTKLSYSIEQIYLETSPVVRQMFNGVRIGTMALSMESQSIANVSFTTMGTNSEYLDAAPAGQTYYRETLTEVLNTSSNIGRIAENGVPIPGNNCIMSANLTIENNLRGKPCVGVIGYADIGAGRCNVTGSLNTYFGSAAIAKKILSNEESGVDFRFTAADSATVIYDVPRLKYTEGGTPITGIDTDVMLDASFQGLKHPAYGYTVHIQRFAATQ